MNDVVPIKRRTFQVQIGTSSPSEPPEPPRAAGEDSRHVVWSRAGQIDQAADEAIIGLMGEGSPYYQRGECLVREVRGVSRPAAFAGGPIRPAAPFLATATTPMLQDDLERTCRFMTRHEVAETAEVRLRTVACPKPLPAVILSRAGRLPVPSIRGIAEVPLLHADGSIVFDGYDPRAQVVVVAPGEWPAVPERPTDDDVRQALERIQEVIAGFPFVNDCDRAVVLAMIISAVIRPTLPACPAFGVTSPIRGSGKSKLGDIAAVVATGRTAPAMSWPRQEDEAEKRLAATVMSGDAVIMLDNIETALRGDCLNSLLTQPVVSLRVLGRSQMLRVSSSALVLATGNNLILQGDLTRRFLVSHLDPHDERPELRQFAFDPVQRALTERGALVAAVHTIVRWGARQSVNLAPLGSFEAWSRRVRDPLVALGLANCCEVLDELHKEDPEREVALDVLDQWHAKFGLNQQTVAEVVREATSTERNALRSALDPVSGGPGGLNPKRLGKYLARIKDRVFGSYVMRRGASDLASNVATWQIEKIDRVTGFPGTIPPVEKNRKEERGGLDSLPTLPVTRSAAAYLKAKEGERSDDIPF